MSFSVTGPRSGRSDPAVGLARAGLGTLSARPAATPPSPCVVAKLTRTRGRGSSRLCRDCRFDQPVELGEGAVGGAVLGQDERPPGGAPRGGRFRVVSGRRTAPPPARPRRRPAGRRRGPAAARPSRGSSRCAGRTGPPRRRRPAPSCSGRPGRASGCRRRRRRRPGPRPPTARRSCRSGSPAVVPARARTASAPGRLRRTTASPSWRSQAATASNRSAWRGTRTSRRPGCSTRAAR